MGFRDYDPTTGRYIIPDTVDGDEDTPLSQNKYLYAEGDPINNIDPDGHWIIDAIFLAVDVVDFIKKPTWGKALMIGLDVLSFADRSGGASTALHAAKAAIKTAKAVDHAVDGAKAVKRTVNVTKQISKAKKVYKVAKKTAKVEKVVDSVHDVAVAGDKVKDVVKEVTKADDFAKTPFVPDEYWKRNAPDFNTPGSKITHYKDNKGVIEKSTVIYDDFG